MEKFDESMYNEDEFAEGPSSQTNNGGTGATSEQSNTNDHNSTEEEDLTTEVLRMKGISDPSKIQFQDETGAVIERSWDSLTRQEQLNILSDQVAEESELSEDEAQLLSHIRKSGMSVQEFVDSLQSVDNTPATPSYKIDALSDDEVYVLDLLDKIGSDNITDEEIEQTLASAKANPSIFKKTVDGLRAEYIRLQKDEEAKIANEQAAQQKAAYDLFATSITREIQDFDSFMGQPLELSRDDQEELAAFMLDIDEYGASAFGRALNNPKHFTRAAFWLLNEDKIEEELTKQMLENYKRGYEQARRDLSGQKSRLIFSPKAKQTKDPFADDEDW